MTTVAEAEVAAEAGSQAKEGFNLGDLIMHHVLDSGEIEIPFTDKVIHLPSLEFMGIDISITRQVVMMWIAATILVLTFSLVAWQARHPVPRGLRGLLEILILFVRDEIARKAIGKDGDRYLGYLLTTFFFILTCNLLGLVPGMSTATGNISVTATLALIAFVMIQFAGIRAYGVVGHVRNVVPQGFPSWLLPLMIPIEIIGVFTKPFALCVRLFANMTAGHVVIISFVGLIFVFRTVFVATVSVPFVLFIDLLEILIALIQAFIFTMLTALFIGMSAHPTH